MVNVSNFVLVVFGKVILYLCPLINVLEKLLLVVKVFESYICVYIRTGADFWLARDFGAMNENTIKSPLIRKITKPLKFQEYN